MDKAEKIEQVLRDSEEKYRKVFSTSRDSCFLFDLETLDILDVNTAASTLYGYSQVEFLRMKMSAVWAQPEQSMASMREMVNDEITFIPLRYHKKKDGAIFPVEVTPAYFQLNGRKVVFGAIRDISERVKTEKDLQFKDFALDHSADAAFWMDPQGRFVYVNQAACASLGYTREELLSMRLADIDPDFPVEVWPQAWEEVRRLKVRTLVARHRTKEGRIFPVEVTANYVIFSGQEYNCTMVRNISDRQRLEEIARRSEKMSAIGQLAAGVAHELNNPLSVILGFAQSLARRVPESDPTADPLRSVEREALRCRNLVQNLLLFSREHKPGFSLDNPVTMLRNAMSLVEAQAKVKRVEVRKEIAPDVMSVEMDTNQIQQVIINLCSNAMDAMPDGGILTVGLGREDDEISIRVADTGSGIPKEIRDRIWEPFFTTKEAGKGTGLGLSLVYEIVQKHHGQIDLESEVGKGAAFTLYLPMSQSKQLPPI